MSGNIEEVLALFAGEEIADGAGGLIIAPTGYGQLLVLKGRRWPGAVAGGIGGVVLLVALPPAVASWGAYGAVVAAGAAWLLRAVILFACALMRPKVVAPINP